jgi:hypothetical protein
MERTKDLQHTERSAAQMTTTSRVPATPQAIALSPLERRFLLISARRFWAGKDHPGPEEESEWESEWPEEESESSGPEPLSKLLPNDCSAAAFPQLTRKLRANRASVVLLSPLEAVFLLVAATRFSAALFWGEVDDGDELFDEPCPKNFFATLFGKLKGTRN